MPEGAADFRAVQLEFTAHIRDPKNSPAPAGMEDRRLGIYRELLYKNVESFVANSFPVLRSIMGDEVWHEMIRDYFSQHVARTPLFPKLPQEFLLYLAAESTPSWGLDFIQELAHYEWLELETLLDKRDIFDIEVNASATDIDAAPVLNPIARVHAYSYPVHRISPEFMPERGTEPTYLVVYRDREDEVGFMELNPITARLVDLILHDPHASARTLLMQIANEMQHPDPAVVVCGGTDILNELARNDVVLGAVKLS